MNDSQTNLEENKNAPIPNSLALTLRKDYNFFIVKNFLFKTFRSTWKVAFSVFTLNVLKLFL